MAIVPIRDEYVEDAWFQAGSIAPHSPYPLGGGKVMLVRSSPWDSSLSHSRIYTITSSGWTQGDAKANPLLPVNARAGAATLDGLMLLQADGGHTFPALSNYWLYDAVTGATVVPPVAVSGDNDDGPLYTAPESMVRIPGTNYFWAWRYYTFSQVFILDVLLVNNGVITLVGTELLFLVQLGYIPAYVPRAIVPTTGTEAMSVVAFPNGALYLIHAIRTSTDPTVVVQQISGYPAAVDPCLYPGTLHPAEMMLLSPDLVKQVRVGVSFTSGSFVLDALPVTQLDAALKPTAYSGKAVISPNDGARFQVIDDSLIVARKFLDDGSNDNWTLLTQYNLTDGTIIANTWTKGDLNGGAAEELGIREIEICFESGSDRLILADTDYRGSDSSLNPRLGVYRLSYVIESSSRSQRETFER